MAVELKTIVEILTTIPNIINSLVGLSSELKIGVGGSKRAWNEMQAKLDELREKLKDFGTLGHFVRDYVMLLGISTDNNNRVDHIIKTMIPYAKKSPDKVGAKKMLQTEYERMCQDFSKGLKLFFNVTRYVDKGDVGTISTYISQINDALNQCNPYLEKNYYDQCEKLLKDSSSKLMNISGLCTTKIESITEQLISYGVQIP